MARTPAPGWRRPGVDPEATQAFTAADIADLRALIAKQGEVTTAATKALRGRQHRATPPNLGSGLTVVLVALIIAACAVAVVFGWLVLAH